MRQFKLLLLILPFFLTCQVETERSVIDKREMTLLEWDTIGRCDLLNPSNQNSLMLRYNKQELSFNYLDCFSKKVGDTVILNLVRGLGPVDYLTIRIVNQQFVMDYARQDEGYSSKFHKLGTAVSFCPGKIIPNDTTSFRIAYKGIYRTKSGNTDTVKIEGNLKAKIHGARYDYETHRFERDSLKMVLLMNLEGIDSIREINFSRCGLRQLPGKLSGFKNLEYLTLDLNDLSQDDFYLLGKLKKLKYLSIRRCNISTFPNSLLEISSLEELDISNNKIAFIPNEIFLIKNLQTLNIIGNKSIQANDLLKNNRKKINIIY